MQSKAIQDWFSVIFLLKMYENKSINKVLFVFIQELN